MTDLKKLAQSLCNYFDWGENSEQVREITMLLERVQKETMAANTDPVRLLEYAYDILIPSDRPDKFMPLKREFIKLVRDNIRIAPGEKET